MKHVSILFLLFLISLFPGCSDDDEWRGEDKPREGILLTLTNGALANTKSPALGSTANLHHVTDVYAVLYHLNDAGSDGTFKLCKKLDWNPMDSAEYAVDQVQFYQFWFSEENGAQNLPAGNYRVLCIGLDNRLPTQDQQNRIPGEQWPDNQANYHTSGATYNLPESIKDKPLSEALATLAEGKTQEDIAHSELFAGWTDFEYMPGTLSEVQVEMKRRVAGAICYLSDIPFTLTQDAATYRVTGVRLCLCQPQNKQIALCRVESQPDAAPTVAADYGSLPFADGDGSEVLAEHSFYKLSDDGQQLTLKEGYSKQAAENLYRIENKAYNRPIKENSILMGAYLLPLKRLDTATGSTLKVQLMGRQIEETGTDTGTNLDASIPEEVIRELPALNSERVDGEDETQYNIHPNYIYQIGRKPTPGLSQDEYPESLMGNRLFLRVLKWTQEEIPVEFPSVPIYATMDFELEGMTMDCMGTPWYDEFKGSFPFDKTEEIEYHKLHITPSLLGKPWRLVIQDDGLYIRTTHNGNPDDEEFSKTYESDPKKPKESVDLDMLLEDYIVARDYEHDREYKGVNIENDYRTIKLRLITYNDSLMTTPIHEDSISIKQYNAITVQMNEEKRAFARFDLGTEHFASGGFTSSFRMKWGYRGVIGTEILGVADKDRLWWGSFNYRRAKEEAQEKWNSHPDQFKISAIRHGARRRVTINKDQGTDVFKLVQSEENEKFWYLPAYNEMKFFLSLPKKYASSNPTKAIQQMNLKTYDANGTEDEKTGIYWSSTPNYGGTSASYNTAWTFYLYKSGSVSDEKARDKNDELFIRQACIMPGQKK